MTRTDRLCASVLATLYAAATFYAALVSLDLTHIMLFASGAVVSSYLALMR